MIEKWEMLVPGFTMEHLGLVPYWFDSEDKRTVRELIETYYQHGGGFRNIDGCTMAENQTIKYPGDPRMKPLAKMQHGDELVLMYDYAILAIVQPDGTFQVTRVD